MLAGFACCAVLILSLFGLPGTETCAHAGERETVRAMAGEEYRYGIDFLAFRNLAEGGLSFSRETVPGHYRAELEARTLGVAAWLTGDRTQRYESVMEEAGDGSLRSVSYEAVLIKRKNGEWTRRTKHYRFDYLAGKVYLEQSDGGPRVKISEYPLPAGQTPVDILTGFYNLRLGVYGALVPGACLQIPTFTSKGISVIKVEVLGDDARQARAFFPSKGILLRIQVDPEVFQTGNTSLYAFLDENGCPSHGIVEDIIGMGDVYGYLQPAIAPTAIAQTQ